MIQFGPAAIVPEHGMGCSKAGLARGHDCSAMLPKLWNRAALKHLDSNSSARQRWPETCYARRQHQTVMTCRYAHKRIATLFTVVQATAAARVIDWPQRQNSNPEYRNRLHINGR